MAEVNGKTVGISVTAVASSVLVAFGSLVWSHVSTVRKSAEIALQVAKDHGTELEAIRAKDEQIVMKLAELSAQISLGGRFTSQDGDRLRAQMDRIQAEVDRLVGRLTTD